MWKRIVTETQELVKLAEGFNGKTGPEKRAVVVAELSRKINIPLLPDWLENLLEPVLYGFIVDAVVKWWNALTEHRLEEIPANEETAAVMAGVVVEEVKAAAAGVPLEPIDISGKFDALVAKYRSGEAAEMPAGKAGG